MKNRELTEKIYNDLNKRGAGLGNASIGIIKKTLNEHLGSNDTFYCQDKMKQL